MTSAVPDASAVLALARDKPGADKVEAHIGPADMSAINLQEVVKELLLSGLDEPTIRDLLGELRIDIRSHDADAAYAATALHAQMRDFGRGIGDRSCLAVAIQLGVPALTADAAWRKMKAKNLKVGHIR